MKKTYLRFYNKVIVALFTVFIILTGCCTKKIVEKQEKVSEKKDKFSKKDSVSTYKKENFREEEIIVMYGVRPYNLNE
ncbi:MAG: hypothetical protein ACYC2P_00230 [Paludibacteraceae bacterium]